MRNVEFREDKGPGIIRRILAFLLVVLGIAAATAYTLVLAPRTYSSSLTLLQSQPEVCDRLLASTLDPAKRAALVAAASSQDEDRRDDIEAVLQSLVFEKKPDNLLVMTCTETHLPGLTDPSVGPQALHALLNAMKDGFAAQDEARIKNALAVLEEKKKVVRSRLADLAATATRKTTPEAEAALKGLEAAGNGVDWPDGGWQAAFESGGETGRIVADLETQLTQARELSRQIHRDRAIAAELDKYVHASENQTVTHKAKRVVYHEDSPELIRIKDQKAELEAQRMRLLRRATTAHPLARKLSAQIDELQAQIEAMTRQPQVVEDVVEQTNTEIVRWQKELADVQAAVKGSQTRLGLMQKNLLALTARLKQAAQTRRLNELSNDREKLDRELADLNAQKPMATAMPFEVWQVSEKPVVTACPNYLLIYGAGLAAGLICAFFLLITRTQTRFNVIEKPEEPKLEYPVLGSIPRFEESDEKKESA